MDENTSNEQPIKNRKGLSIFFNILIIFLSIIALSIAGVLIYQKRYLDLFWVNGQSMYPTLNRYAIRADGTEYGANGSSTQAGSKKIDYVAVDRHDRALKGLERFDIVICRYSEEDKVDKVKRVVGMPGETIKFGQGDNNGKLYIKKDGEFVTVDQPVDNQYVAAGAYPSGEITLAKYEYYVLGDNRQNSSDSRANGPVKYQWLIGKVVCVCAHCEVVENSNGTLEPTNVDHFLPRFL